MFNFGNFCKSFSKITLSNNITGFRTIVSRPNEISLNNLRDNPGAVTKVSSPFYYKLHTHTHSHSHICMIGGEGGDRGDCIISICLLNKIKILTQSFIYLYVYRKLELVEVLVQVEVRLLLEVILVKKQELVIVSFK